MSIHQINTSSADTSKENPLDVSATLQQFDQSLGRNSAIDDANIAGTIFENNKRFSSEADGLFREAGAALFGRNPIDTAHQLEAVEAVADNNAIKRSQHETINFGAERQIQVGSHNAILQERIKAELALGQLALQNRQLDLAQGQLDIVQKNAETFRRIQEGELGIKKENERASHKKLFDESNYITANINFQNKIQQQIANNEISPQEGAKLLLQINRQVNSRDAFHTSTAAQNSQFRTSNIQAGHQTSNQAPSDFAQGRIAEGTFNQLTGLGNQFTGLGVGTFGTNTNGNFNNNGNFNTNGDFSYRFGQLLGGPPGLTPPQSPQQFSGNPQGGFVQQGNVAGNLGPVPQGNIQQNIPPSGSGASGGFDF